MARNTASLPATNVFKPATTTIEATSILAEQITAYEGLLRSLGHPLLYEPLRENDLSQVRTLIAAMAQQLQVWLALPNNA